MIHVRLASVDDLEPMTAALVAGWREGYRDMFSVMVFLREDFDEQRLKRCHELLLDDFVEVHVAEPDNRVVGWIAVEDVLDVTRITELWVHPHAWGSGAAQALLAGIEDQRRNTGRTHFAAWLPEDSPRARRFFEKAGWRPTGAIGALEEYPDEPNRTFEYTRTLV